MEIVPFLIFLFRKLKPKKYLIKIEGQTDLPSGCKKCIDPKVLRRLDQMHKWEKSLEMSPEMQKSDLPEFNLEISGPESNFFKNKTNQISESCSYKNGYAIHIKEGGIIIIFKGWLPLKEIHSPSVYIYGNIPKEVIRTKIETFCFKAMDLAGRKSLSKMRS